MSFRIFASGVVLGQKNFHYAKSNCIDGDEFDAMKLYQTLGFMDHSGAGAVDGTLGHLAPGITDLYIAQAKIVYLRALKREVDLLGMRNKTDRARRYHASIRVQCTEKHMLWANTNVLANYYFSPGNSPGTEFIKTIVPALKKTDMNNFGVLMQLSLALNRYSRALKSAHDPPSIHIHLTN